MACVSWSAKAIFRAFRVFVELPTYGGRKKTFKRLHKKVKCILCSMRKKKRKRKRASEIRDKISLRKWFKTSNAKKPNPQVCHQSLKPGSPRSALSRGCGFPVLTTGVLMQFHLCVFVHGANSVSRAESSSPNVSQLGSYLFQLRIYSCHPVLGNLECGLIDALMTNTWTFLA